ncbi:MAG: Spy/CpxP family protein refolding chaperone [Rhodospirillales bacterium]|nr:Spy/CpxP family protein refolding chaperone [Rhodospirillales bacterium]
MPIPKSVYAVAIAAGLAAALPTAEVAFAQPAPGAAAHKAQEEHRARPSRIEGRLAFLKTELKITDAQSQQWNAFADVLRQQDKARRERFEQYRATKKPDASALERLERRQKASEARAEEMKAFLAAFRPLYAALDEQQKKTADELFSWAHRHRMHRR